MALRDIVIKGDITYTNSSSPKKNYYYKERLTVYKSDYSSEHGYAWFNTKGVLGFDQSLFKSIKLRFNCISSDTSSALDYIEFGTNQQRSLASEITWNNSYDYSFKRQTYRVTSPTSPAVIDVPISLSVITDEYTDTSPWVSMKVSGSGCFSADSVSIIITIDDGDINVEPTYPIGVNINNTQDVIFTWNYYSDSPQEYIEFRLSGSQFSYEVTQEMNEHYIVVPSSAFKKRGESGQAVGPAYWHINVRNEVGQTYYGITNVFTLYGETDAPIIDSVSNSPRPTVAWSTNFQDCYQVEFYKSSNDLIYNSGLQIGQNVRTFTCPYFLPNGNYYLKLRVLNTFGYYTDYVSFSFVLDYDNCDQAEDIFVAVNSDYGVEISATIPDDTNGYIFKDGEYFEEYPEYGKFIDYTSPLNIEKVYTIATASSTAMTIPDGTTVMVRENGVVIHDLRNFKNWIHFDKTDDDAFDVQRADTYTKTFRQVIGRTYPIKEQMDYVVSTRSFTAFVNHDDYIRLMEICQNGIGVYYRADEEAFKADIDVSDRGYYISGGRLVTVSITRLNEE